MPIAITPELLVALRRAANMAMWQEWRAANSPGMRVYEVPCIKNLVDNGIPRVQQVWARLLSTYGITVTLTGVVCHGRPFVIYPGAARACELGDLVLVHDHVPDRGGLERRATVIQAKVFGPTGVTSRNETQLGLYCHWPQFIYTDWPGGLSALSALLTRHGITGPNALERHVALTASGHGVAAAELDAGCRYGMIDIANSPWGDPYLAMNPWRLCSPNVPDLYHHHWGFSLGGYLVRLMRGLVGRTVPSPGWPAIFSGSCHWSLMVEELLALLPPAAGTGAALSLIATGATTGGAGGRSPPLGGLRPGDGDGAFAAILLSTRGGPDALG